MANNIKQNFTFVCDHAFVANSKVSMVGIFERIYAKSFPTTHPTMFLVENLTVSIPKNYRISIDLIDDSGVSIIGNPLIFERDVKEDSGTIGIIAQLIQTTFKKPGKYLFKIYVNDAPLVEYPLILEQIP